MRKTLAVLTALALGSGGAQVGTYEFTIGDLAQHLKYQDRVNTYRCGKTVRRILDPELLGARGVIVAANTVDLRIPWNPGGWQLSSGGRGKTLPLQAAEVVYDDGGQMKRTLGGKRYLRYDPARKELRVALRLNPDRVRGMVGQILIGDRSCSAQILFTVRSLGPG